MNELILIKPSCREKGKEERLTEIVEESIKGFKYERINTVEEFEMTDLKNKKILFAISLGESGINLELYAMLKKIRLDNYQAYINSGKNLVQRLVSFKRIKREKPNILVLHSSNRQKSNSFVLWSKIKEKLTDCEVNEISLENGKIFDCIGCPYNTCLHFGEKGKCVYGGVIVEKVYPAILKCDALVMICPNYNDALGANLAAFVNRLTALFRNNDFSEKSLFAIIVSGYSGGDIVAQQLISGINMNKAFILPGKFALIETANNPNTVLKIKGIEEKVCSFAENIIKSL